MYIFCKNCGRKIGQRLPDDRIRSQRAKRTVVFSGSGIIVCEACGIANEIQAAGQDAAADGGGAS